jgi:alkylation response protein AidB-like acyl-CoA dehydrogenase
MSTRVQQPFAACHQPPSEEVALLRESVRDSLNALHQGTPDEHWAQSWHASWNTLTRQGLWSTIQKPDGSLAMAAVVAEELGRALYPGPACETTAATYILDRLDEFAKTTSGAPGAVAFASDQSPMVHVAPDTQLIVATDRDDLVAVSVDDINCCEVASLDVTRRIVRPGLQGRSLTVLSASHSGLARQCRAVTALLFCADTLGCVEHVLNRTAEYAAQRTTFGSPIGKYQAVAHRLVDHAVTAQQMRLLLDAAIAAVDQASPDLKHHVATAETFFFRRSSEIISDCVQLAGAIGFTWEFGHHFYLRRVVQNTALAGGRQRPHQQLAAVAPW